MFEVVVVRGGPAGVTAALRSGELGAEVALVERGNRGGTCTNDGCVPTRVLARAARLVRDAEQLADVEFAYPTFTALVGLAARSILRELGLVAVSPRWGIPERTLRTEWEHRDG